MFYGSFHHSVDSKGRVAVPAQFRPALVGAVIAPGFEGRLVIRPPEEWRRYEDHFRLTADSSAQERRFIRHLYAGARELEIDSQGRMLLSPDHRRFSQIDDRVVFVGVSNAVEIVAEAAWEAEQAELGPDAFTVLGDSVSRSAAGERA